MREALSDIPDIVIQASASHLLPENFSKLLTPGFPSPHELEEIDNLLSFLSHHHKNENTRKLVSENARLLLENEDLSKIILSIDKDDQEKKLREILNEKHTTVANKLLLIIMLNQTDRKLQSTWQAMIDKKTTSKDPFANKLLREGSPILGLYGLALMPNENGDYSKPSMDVMHPALNEIKEDRMDNFIPVFANHLRSIFPNIDAREFLDTLISSADLPKYIIDLISYKEKIAIDANEETNKSLLTTHL